MKKTFFINLQFQGLLKKLAACCFAFYSQTLYIFSTHLLPCTHCTYWNGLFLESSLKLSTICSDGECGEHGGLVSLVSMVQVVSVVAMVVACN